MDYKTFRTLRDLMNGQPSAEIRNLLEPTMVVRRLTVKGNDVEVDLCGPTPPGIPQVMTFSLNQPLMYDPWFMDRGSIMLQCKLVPEGEMKLCTEHDPIVYPDKQQFFICPDPKAPKVDHEVRFRNGTDRTIAGVPPHFTGTFRSDPRHGGMW